MPGRHLSVSQLRLLLGCARQWRLQYLDGLRPPPTVDLVVGVVWHAAIEDYLGRRLRRRAGRPGGVGRGAGGGVGPGGGPARDRLAPADAGGRPAAHRAALRRLPARPGAAGDAGGGGGALQRADPGRPGLDAGRPDRRRRRRRLADRPEDRPRAVHARAGRRRPAGPGLPVGLARAARGGGARRGLPCRRQARTGGGASPPRRSSPGARRRSWTGSPGCCARRCARSRRRPSRPTRATAGAPAARRCGPPGACPGGPPRRPSKTTSGRAPAVRSLPGCPRLPVI